MNRSLFVYEKIALYISERQNGVSRRDIAAVFGITKTTAVFHLESLVGRGALYKVWTITNGSYRGWVYYHNGEPYPFFKSESVEMVDVEDAR
jgi:predicted ArsR family transcriptional regulator